jgi:hypothetical protein
MSREDIGMAAAVPVPAAVFPAEAEERYIRSTQRRETKCPLEYKIAVT